MKRILLSLFLSLSCFATPIIASAQNQNASQSVTIKVQSISGLTITAPATIPSVVIVNGVPKPYAGATFTVSGGTAPYTWTVSAGSLPAGLTLSTSGTNGINGVISGTPLATAATSTFTIQVTDSSATVTSINLQWNPTPNTQATN